MFRNKKYAELMFGLKCEIGFVVTLGTFEEILGLTLLAGI
jgi:uncharacterized protein YlaN (UPF0358 family)